MPQTVGVILAGGGGSRLGGVIKANIDFGGERLGDRLARILRAQTDLLILSSGRFGAGEIRLTRPLPEVLDARGGGIGPVAGIAAAVEWCRTASPEARFLLSAAVDSPFFPLDFAARAGALIRDGVDLVVGAQEGQPFPTNALWRLASLEGLPARIASGRPPKGLKDIIPAARTVLLNYRAGPFGEPFANINTPADLAACLRRLGPAGEGN